MSNEVNKDELAYLGLLKKALYEGAEKGDRTGTGVFSLCGESLSFDISNGIIPLLTTKQMSLQNIVWELIFFIRGATQTSWLSDRGVKIWSGNTRREALDRLGLNHLEEGNMGKLYPYQWRSWGKTENSPGIDQLAEALRLIKEEPDSRRIVMCSWNTSDLKEMCLSPCHPLIQFYVNKDELSCVFTSRSGDAFLGIPYNFCSYAILTHIMAKAAGLKGKKVVAHMGDVHIYKNHIQQVKEQLTRTPYNFPTLEITKNITNITDMENLVYEDFKLHGYISHPFIKASMAV